MSQGYSLYDVITEVDSSHEPKRDEVLIFAPANDDSVDSVVVYKYGQSRGGFMSGFWGQPKGRWLKVETNRSIAFNELPVHCLDVQSGISFDLLLALDVKTPKDSQTELLHKLGHSFRFQKFRIGDASKGHRPPPGNELDRPDSYLSQRLTDWLRDRYRRGGSISEFDFPTWRRQEAEAIEAEVAEYGLDAIARLNIRVDPDALEQKPVTVSANVPPKDTQISDDSVKTTLTVGYRIDKTNPFEAPALSEEAFQDLILREMRRYIGEDLTLQQYRFEPAWIDKLKGKIAGALKQYDRTVTKFTTNWLPDSEYSVGPHDVEAEDCTFVPAGWKGADTDPNAKISFRANAKVLIAKAAKFERLLRDEDEHAGAGTNTAFRKDLLKSGKIREILADWLKTALQSAVDECLHPLHDSAKGYASLLMDWVGTYEPGIVGRLNDLAKEKGLEINAIIAKPDRPEIDMLKGLWLDLPEQQLPSTLNSATLGLTVSVNIKVEEFSDISDILNRSATPLEIIKDDLILDQLKLTAREMGYIQFHKAFDVADSNGIDEKFIAKDKFKEDLEARLEEEKIKVIGFRAERTPTREFEIFEGLSKSPHRAVTFKTNRLPYYTKEGDDVSEQYPIGFDLKITGISDENFERFFSNQNWDELEEEHGSCFLAVRNAVEASLGNGFTETDAETLMLANNSEEDRDNFVSLLQNHLNAYLSQTFGLMGEALAAKRGLSGYEEILIALEEGKREKAKEKIEGELKRTKIISEGKTKKLELDVDKEINRARLSSEGDVDLDEEEIDEVDVASLGGARRRQAIQENLSNKKLSGESPKKISKSDDAQGEQDGR